MANQLYTNGRLITQAFKFDPAGNTTPLDIRLVATSVNALYINANTEAQAKESFLYGQAYRGMPVAIVDENTPTGTNTANDVKIYVLKDETPYKNGNFGSKKVPITDQASLEKYWTEIGKSLNDEITDEILPTLDCLTRYVKAGNVSAKNGKGIKVDTSAYSISKDGFTINDALSYTVEIIADGSTVDFNANNKLTGGLYRVASQGSGSATTYKLQFKAANGTAYSDVANSSTIEIHSEDWALNSRVADVSTYAINVSSNLASVNTALTAKINDVSTKLASANASIVDISTKLVNIGSVVNTQITPLNASLIDISTKLVDTISKVSDISTNRIPALVDGLLEVSTYAEDVSTVANNAKTQATTNAANISAISSQLTQTITNLLDVSTRVDVLDTCVGDVYKFADENEKVIAAALTDMDLRLIGLDITSLFDDAANASITYDKRDADDLKYGRVFVKTVNPLDPAAPRADVMRMINTDANATDQYIYYYDDYTIASDKVTIQRNYITGVLKDSSIVENVVRQRQWKRTSKKTITLYAD